MVIIRIMKQRFIKHTSIHSMQDLSLGMENELFTKNIQKQEACPQRFGTSHLLEARKQIELRIFAGMKQLLGLHSFWIIAFMVAKNFLYGKTSEKEKQEYCCGAKISTM